MYVGVLSKIIQKPQLALNSYLGNYPKRPQPNEKYFLKFIKNFRVFGRFEKLYTKNYAKDNNN